MSLEPLHEIAEGFRGVEPDMRLELLLDYARQLPPLPERLREQRDQGLNRVPECMTPVFLWIEPDGDGVQLHVDVAEEAPTVKGLLAIIVEGCTGQPAQDVADLPTDLLHRLGLEDLIRMQRAVGISGIIGRIRRQAAKLISEKA